MRDIESIDAELQLLARAWRVARELCDRPPSTAHIDELLDERSATSIVNSTITQADSSCSGLFSRSNENGAG